MKLRLLFTNSDSSCPTVYVAEDGDMIVQGPALDVETAGELTSMLEGETAVKVAPALLLGAVDRYRAGPAS